MKSSNDNYVSKWTQRKHRNLYLAVLAYKASESPRDKVPLGYHYGDPLHSPVYHHEYGFDKKARKLMKCGTYLNTIVNSKGHHMPVATVRCHQRFCNICQTIASRIRTNMLYVIIKHVLSLHYKNGRPKYRLLFVTPTTPNVDGDYKSIKRGLEQLHQYVSTFLNSGLIRGWKCGNRSRHGIAKGAIAKFEHVDKIVNGKPSVNQHCHIPLLVHASYKKTSKFYLNNRMWDRLWHEATGHNDYRIKVEACYYADNKGKHVVTGNNPKAVEHVAKEVGKYTAKGQDLFKTGKKSLDRQVHNLMSKKHLKRGKRSHALHVLKSNLKPSSLPVQFFMNLVLAYQGSRDIRYYGLFRKACNDFEQGKLSKDNFNDDSIYYLNSKLRYKFKRHAYDETVSSISPKLANSVLYSAWLQGRNLKIADENGQLWTITPELEKHYKLALKKSHNQNIKNCIRRNEDNYPKAKALIKNYYISAECAHYWAEHPDRVSKIKHEPAWFRYIIDTQWHLKLAERVNKPALIYPPVAPLYSDAVNACHIGKRPRLRLKALTRLFNISAECTHYKCIHLNSIMEHALEDGARHSNYSATYQKLMQCVHWHVAVAHRLGKAPKVTPSQFSEFKPSVFEAEISRVCL